jgi:NAD(P)-dependent dehydrogenase (short-subunit alcohol dehydrogenase family)
LVCLFLLISPAFSAFGLTSRPTPVGLLNTTRAFLPLFRSHKSRTIVNLSSIAGLRGGEAMGLYSATKFAVEGASLFRILPPPSGHISLLRNPGITESLALEVAHLNLRALVVSPGYFRTNFLASGQPHAAGPIEDYKPVTIPFQASLEAYNGKQPGDAKKGVNLIIDVVLGEGQAKGKA